MNTEPATTYEQKISDDLPGLGSGVGGDQLRLATKARCRGNPILFSNETLRTNFNILTLLNLHSLNVDWSAASIIKVAGCLDAGSGYFLR